MYNMKIKRPLIKIPPKVLNEARLKLDGAVKILEPYLVLLTPSEKLSFKKAGAGLIKFLELSHGLAVESPGLFPVFIETEVFREEYFTTRELWVLANKINQFSECVSDSVMLSGSRTLEIAMAFYQTVKIAARRDIPGARIIFDDLKSALPSGAKGRKKQAKDYDEHQPELFDDL